MVDAVLCGTRMHPFNGDVAVLAADMIIHTPLVGLVPTPKFAFALQANDACRNDTGNMRPQRAKPFDVRSDFGVHTHRFDVFQWDLQTTLQSPQLIPTLHFNDQFFLCYRYFSHTVVWLMV